MSNDNSLSGDHFETKDVSFGTALKWLIYKNFKQQFLRRPCALACKLLLPAICIILLGVIRGFFKAESPYVVYPSYSYTTAVEQYSLQPEYWIDDAICNNDYYGSYQEVRVFYTYNKQYII